MEAAELQLQNLDLFNEGVSFISASRLYFTYFKKVPSIKILMNIEGTKIRLWLENENNVNIDKIHSVKKYVKSEKLSFTESHYLLKNGLLINLDADTVRIFHDHTQDTIAEELVNKFKQYFRVPPKLTQNICIVTLGQSGLVTYPLKIKKPKLVLNKNYNDDLSLVHQKLVPVLKQKDKSGLVLFHGKPGTGKSTYIRYLISSINKKVIFMPPGLAGNLDAPNLAAFLINNANTVFVIEDAEELLASRDANKNSSISMLLNLTDGLLGETLGIQVIATFNTDLQNIDKALLRKGRLLALYEFKPLANEKSRALLQESGIKDYFVSEPMTLADIYHFKLDGYQVNNNTRTQIGFLSTAV